MAAVWLDSDRFVLMRLAVLVDQAHRGVATAAMLAEIRAVEDRFGLSPLARQRLRWTVETVGPVAPVEPEVPMRGEERWLRAVSDADPG